MNITLDEIADLNRKYSGSDIKSFIGDFFQKFGKRIALSSSLGAEDQVLTDIIASSGTDHRIFTLDTGRLPVETYDTIDETNKKYGIKIEVYFPDYISVQEMVNTKGINLFYESAENRKLCCGIRKVEPLGRVLKTIDVWVTGLRKEQSATRSDIELIEWDNANRIMKLNPLKDWSEKEVWDYIKSHNVPYNKLHDKNYPSIGCAPCTRAIEPGEDIRAGRWWWELDAKECGLHFQDGKLVRNKT